MISKIRQLLKTRGYDLVYREFPSKYWGVTIFEIKVSNKYGDSYTHQALSFKDILEWIGVKFEIISLCKPAQKKKRHVINSPYKNIIIQD